MKKIIEKELIELIGNTPLAMRSMLDVNYFIDRTSYWNIQSRGFTAQMPNGRYGIALSYECDNMAKTLVHEALHIKCPLKSESIIEKLTNKFWNIQSVRKKAQETVVDKLKDYNL